MPPEHSQVQLEKQGLSSALCTCPGVGWCWFQQYHTEKSAWFWTSLCQWLWCPLHVCRGVPSSLLLPWTSCQQAQAGRWAPGCQYTLVMGWVRAEQTERASLLWKSWNGWVRREAKCYFLNESPRVKASGLCTAAEADAATRWVIKEMPAPVWTHFLFWHSGNSHILVILCSSCLSHMLGEECLSQKGRYLPTKWGSKAKPRGERFSHDACFGISHVKCLYR